MKKFFPIVCCLLSLCWAAPALYASPPVMDGFESGELSSSLWTTGGDADWGLFPGDAYEGDYSAQSLISLDDDQSSFLEASVSFPADGKVVFQYKVSSELKYDFLNFYIDGVQQNPLDTDDQKAQWSGDVDWTQAIYDVGAGDRKFRWEYVKDGSVSSGSDYAWLDDVAFVWPASEPGQQASGLTFNAISETAATIGWTRGNGENCLVVLKAGSPVEAAPVDGLDGADYAADPEFGAGSQLGTAYVVYIGNETSVDVTGLAAGVKYFAAAYEFNGESGTQNYLTGNPAAGEAMFAMTPPGNALAFDGVDDCVEIPYNGDPTPETAITVEAWIKADEWGYQSIVGKAGNTDGVWWNLECWSGEEMGGKPASEGTLLFSIGDDAGNWSNVASSEAMSVGQWHHVAGTFNDGKIKVYVNGVEAGQNGLSVMSPSLFPLMIGAFPGDDGESMRFKGQIDEVRVWNAARTEAEIRADMYNTLNGDEAGLKGYWRFDHLSGAVLTDVTQGNHHGALRNMDPDQAWTASDVGNPAVTSAAVTDVAATSATAGGDVTTEGAFPVTERGVCWDTSQNPTIDQGKTAAASAGAGGFTVSVTGLNPETVYYLRAFATSDRGTFYGEQQTFTTLAPDPEAAAGVALEGSDTAGEMILDWAQGGGEGRLVLIKAGGTVDAVPEDGRTYTANGAFPSGQEIGTGNHVVYAGPADGSPTISGLTPDTVYSIAVYSYNGSGAQINYGDPLIRDVTYGASRYFVNAAATQSGVGTSWNDAFKTLGEALSLCANGEIWVAAGTYYPGENRNDSFYLKNNVAIYGGFAGTETDLLQRDVNANETVLSGDIGVEGDNSDNVYTIVKAWSDIGDTAILDGFTISGANNSTTDGLGGGMYMSGYPFVRNCVFTGNVAKKGGAIRTYNTTAGIANCVFTGNVAQYGGAIASSWANPKFAGCAFIGNTATETGGAVDGPIDATGCLFTQNAAPKGGAVSNSGDFTNYTFTNCTFTNNTADNAGGAIHNAEGSILYCTIVENTAGSQGGGIYADIDIVIKNTLLANNAGGDLHIAANLDGGHNIIETATGNYAPGTGDITGDQPDLKLGDLADNGGPTQTRALLYGSVAINAGRFVPGDPKTDQRGRSRFDDQPDIGAFERILPPGRALSFDGTDDYVHIEHGGELYLDNTSYTIEAWIKPATLSSENYATIIENDGYYLGVNPDGELYTIRKTADGQKRYANGMIPVGQWTYVAAVMDIGQSAGALYVNGEPYPYTTPHPASVRVTDFVRIGANTNGSNLFNGEIDEIRIWNVARTQAEIQAAMQKTLTGLETGLVAYHSFDEPFSSNKLRDLTLNANHGTLRNMNASLAWTPSGAPVGMPVLTTAAPSGVGYVSAESGGNVTDENGTPVSDRGVCWSESPLPKPGDDNAECAAVGSGGGDFSALLSPLMMGTTYYARAYAINASGLSHGNQIQFTTNDNAAPVLDAAESPALTQINEDETSGMGNAVAEIVTGGVTDGLGVDPVIAIAVTAVDNSHGVWQYSLDNGATWADFSDVRGAVADMAREARLLDGTLTGDAAHRIRFIPDPDWHGTSDFAFRAWDKVFGAPGGVADASSESAYVGGKGTFSETFDGATIAVNSVNDAPVLDASRNSGFVLETRPDIPNVGALVADILPDGAVSDVDGAAVDAIAVTSVDNTHGAWQYSLDDGDTWNDFSETQGAVADMAASARLLDAQNRIRFVPDDPAEPVFPSFAFVAWDKSIGAPGETADATAVGGTAAFSEAGDRSFGAAPVPGLWVGDVELNKVSFVGSDTDTATPLPAENPFDMRMLLHLDAGLQVRLLRHVTVMQKRTIENDQETIRRVLITDDALLPNYEGVIRRDGKLVGTRLVSPAFGFDFDQNAWEIDGRIGAGLSASGTVVQAADHPTNPFKHKFHPDHRTGYEVTRRFTLEFNPFDTENDPESYLNKLDGTYSETIEGIHKLPIRMQGTFEMRRVSAIDALNDN